MFTTPSQPAVHAQLRHEHLRLTWSGCIYVLSHQDNNHSFADRLTEAQSHKQLMYCYKVSAAYSDSHDHANCPIAVAAWLCEC